MSDPLMHINAMTRAEWRKCAVFHENNSHERQKKLIELTVENGALRDKNIKVKKCFEEIATESHDRFWKEKRSRDALDVTLEALKLLDDDAIFDPLLKDINGKQPWTTRAKEAIEKAKVILRE